LKTNNIHTNFQLNGISFSSTEEVILFSASISKELTYFLNEWFSKDDFIIVNTSGSTGKPKQIELKKEFMINSALASGKYFDLPNKTTALCCLPIDFIAGKMMLVRALTLGWHLDVLVPNSNPLEFIEKKYNFSAMVPLQVDNSIDRLHLIQKLIIGGGEVSSKLQEKLQEVSTLAFATYGMTETITHIAVQKLNNFSLTEVPVASKYKILPNVQISLDHRNCLVINAPKVSSEIIVTNDVVEITSKTEFIWKGRFDNVINSGGIKIHPEEIEKKLVSFIQSRFFVVGIPDEKLGEKLILIIEGEKSLVISNEVRNLKKVLSKFETPKEIFFISKFMETSTGKIQRNSTLKKVLTTS